MKCLKNCFALAMVLCTSYLLADNEYTFKVPDLFGTLKKHDSYKIVGSGTYSGSSFIKLDEVKKIDNTKNEKKSNQETSPNVSADITMYVNVSSFLNVRIEPWGEVIGTLHNNDKVNVVRTIETNDTEGKWCYIDSPMCGYVSINFLKGASGAEANIAEATGNETAVQPGEQVVTPASSGSFQQAIVDKANEFLETYSYSESYPYRPETDGGSNGCAQVVSECLAQAGINIPTILNTDDLLDYLTANGWAEVDVPPYEAGDVIGWNIGGVENAHVGVLIESGGNSACVMHNSSSRLHPSTMPADYYDVYKVVRKRS